MSSYENIKVGDSVFQQSTVSVGGYSFRGFDGFSASFWCETKVIKVTNTQFVTIDKSRYRKKDGCGIGESLYLGSIGQKKSMHKPKEKIEKCERKEMEAYIEKIKPVKQYLYFDSRSNGVMNARNIDDAIKIANLLAQIEQIVKGEKSDTD